MKTAAAELAEAVLRLPPADRAQVALVAWDSLDSDLGAAFDAEGLGLAQARDRELESGVTQPLSQRQFRRLTGGA